MRKKQKICGLLFLIFFLAVKKGVTQTPAVIGNVGCLGGNKTLVLGNTMPYTTTRVGTAEGYFALDFGTTNSTIDPKGFKNGEIPQPVNGTIDNFDAFDFFGSWGKVTLSPRDYSNLNLPAGFRQGGIIGTDFLSLKVITLDYSNKTVFASSKETFCPDTVLQQQGFKPVSTAGYYSNDLNKLNNTCTANVPTVPVRVGAAYAVAQIDAGLDDFKVKHSVNINTAFFNAIKAAGIKLTEVPKSALPADFKNELSTCPPHPNEKIVPYNLTKGSSFEIIGSDGQPVLISTDAVLFFKQTPIEAKECGGIGTWQIPAAQLGASFLIDAKKVIFDPFTSRVWFKK